MKILVTNYTYDNTTGTITLTDYTSIKIESLLLVALVSSGNNHSILYNFATDTGGFSIINNNRINSSSLIGLNPSSKFLIYYDDTSYDNISINIKNLLTTLTDLTDSMYNVSERLRAFDALRDSNASLRVMPTGGIISTISQLSGIIGDFTSTSTTAGYLRVGALTSQHNSAAQININNIIP